MIQDLEQSDSRVERSTAVCIIGAGTAGLFLAQQLQQQGIRVLLLEAGDSVARTPEELGYRCTQHGIHYRGAESGRSFGLGGTSVLWGGQLIPLVPSDMAARPTVDVEPWPISYADVASYIPLVKKKFSLTAPSDDRDHILKTKHFPLLSRLDSDFELRLSEWLPFRQRNFSQAFSKAIHVADNFEVWLNAPVVKLVRSADATGRIASVEARSPHGRTITVNPEIAVVCAGALESTRLMLEFDHASQNLITRSGAPLGQYFADHLSVTCGRFQCHDWRRYNLETAPIFVDGIMRTPRLELSASAQQRLAVTSAFAHFTFVTHGDTGFDVVRNLLRRQQGERQGLGLSPNMLGRAVRDVSAMALWRGAYRRLWIPRKADLLLQVDIEQTPNPDSRLSLSEDKDDLGRRQLVIDWRIQPEDIRVIRTVADRAVDAWRASGLDRTATLQLTLPDQFDDFESLYDVYHPTGTVRIGSAATNSVVNPDLRVWALDNVYVSSTAVFPSAGSANPGLMHLALTARLAEHIAKQLAVRGVGREPRIDGGEMARNRSESRSHPFQGGL